MSILNKFKKTDVKDVKKKGATDENKIIKKEKVKIEKSGKKDTKKNAVIAPGFSGIERSVLKRPHISEKAYSAQEKNQYIFWVNLSANKPMIKREVEMRYGVHVTSVNTIKNKGKRKMFKGRPSKRKDTKKAVITVRQGEKIDIA